MTALDIFVILLLGGAALVGFVRGFIHEVLALAAWIVGIAALKLFHTPLQERLIEPVGTEAGASVLAFALLFLPAYIGVKLFARAVGGKARRVHPRAGRPAARRRLRDAQGSGRRDACSSCWPTSRPT